MIEVTNRKYFNQLKNGVLLNLNLTTFTDYLIGWVGGLYKKVTEVSIFATSAAVTNGDVWLMTQFQIRGYSASFQDDGFAIGDTIEIQGTWNSVQHIDNVFAVIQFISSDSAGDALTVTVPGNPPNFDIPDAGIPPAFEGSNDCRINLTTPQLALNYFSNIIENDELRNYESKVDEVSERKWTVEFTQAEWDAGTPKTATPSGINNSWKIATDVVTAVRTQKPELTNIWVQKFEVTETFRILPFFDIIDNLELDIKPIYYIGNKSVRHIARITSLPTLLNLTGKHTIDDDDKPETYGNVGYYDEQYNGYTPIEFAFNSITYANTEGKIIISETTGITIKIDSANNVFLQNNSQYQLNILFLNENVDITETVDTNFAFDNVFAVADGGSNAGANGILSNVIGNIVADQLVITADIDYTTAQQALIDGGKYIISVATDNHVLAIDGGKATNVLCDLNTYISDNDVPGLIGVDTNFFYEHPFDKGTQGTTDFKGWVEDGILISADFWLDLSLGAVINTMNLKLVAYNSTTENFFEIADIPFNFSTTIISNGIQEIDIDTTRGFKLIVDSQFNFVKIQKMALVGTKQHYDLDVGIKLQWMDWINLPGADTVFFDGTELQNGLNRLISNYSGNNDYEIVIFIDAEVSDGALNTNYRFISPAIDVYEYETDDSGDPSTIWSGLVETFDQSSNDLLGNIHTAENTDIKVTFTALSGVISDAVLYAIIRLEEFQQGGLMNIYELSSFRDSIVDNPLIPLTGQSKTIYTVFTDRVEVECSIDFTRLNPGSSYKISGRLGTACNEESSCAWESLLSGTGAFLVSLSFIDSDNGWVCGSSGTILNTTDGTTWVNQSSGITSDLLGIFFIDANNGWACGKAGKILNTTDGGANWNIQLSAGITIQFEDIHFIDANTGWVCGNSGITFKTTDGGTNWIFKATGATVTLNSIFFINANNGWACGNNGKIVSTTDGGANWSIQTVGLANLISVFFTDSNTGWICGTLNTAIPTNGTILNTTDGGANWNPQTSGVPENLLSIFFINANNGWACGNNGKILNTTDGGANWNPQTSGTLNLLRRIQMLSETSGFAVGAAGTILKYVCTPDCNIIEDAKLMEDGTKKITESGFIKIRE